MSYDPFQALDLDTILLSQLENAETRGSSSESREDIALDVLWKEICETSELNSALAEIYDPTVRMYLCKTIGLSHMKSTGRFPDSRGIVIMLLDMVSAARSERRQSEGDKGVESAITWLRRAVSLSPQDDEQLPVRLRKLGRLLLSRAELRNSVSDIDYAIECVTWAVHLCGKIGRSVVDILEILGVAHFRRFEHCREDRDINIAIKHQTQAVSLIGSEQKTDPWMTFTLGYLYASRFRHSGDAADLVEAIQHQTCGLNRTADNDVQKPTMLDELASSHWSHFSLLGGLESLQKAVYFQSQATLLAPGGHPLKPGWLSKLGWLYHCQSKHTGELADVNRAISYCADAVLLTPDACAKKPDHLFNLGNAYGYRFERLGKRVDFDHANAYFSEALVLMPNEHSNKAELLTRLGDLHFFLYHHFGQPTGLDRAIVCLSEAELLTPNENPSKYMTMASLGLLHQLRFQNYGQLIDIDRAIACQSAAVLLVPDGNPIKPKVFNDLGVFFQHRYLRLGSLADLGHSIACLTEAALSPLNVDAEKAKMLNNLGALHQYRYKHLGDPVDIDQAISCHSEAMLLTPDENPGKPAILNNLGGSHQCRYEHFGKLEDIDQSIACFIDGVLLTSDEHMRKPALLGNLGNSHQRRYRELGELADLEQSISYYKKATLLSPDRDLFKLGWLSNLGNSYQLRFRRLNELPDIKRAIACRSEAIQLTPDRHPSKPGILDSLGVSYQCRFDTLGELADTNQAIACQLEAVLLTPDGHADRPGRLNNLGWSHQCRFKQLDQHADIDRAISCLTEAVVLTPDGHSSKARRISNLGNSHHSRFERFGKPADMIKSISLFREATHSTTGPSRIRLDAARQWAQLVSLSHPLTAVEAYNHAMELVPKVIWIGSSVNTRYSDIRAIGDIAVEAAAAAISTSNYGLALEWLDAGRSIIWKQTLQLRTPFDDLSIAAPILAERLKLVVHELEANGQQDTATAENPHALENAAQKHRRLAEDYEKLITEVRSLPSFQDFMQSKKVAELMSAAQSGPVVVINVHTSRCDALVLLPHTNDIVHIPLPDLLHSDVVNLQSQMQEALQSQGIRERRMHRPGPKVDDPFKCILAALWHKLVNPILCVLGYTKQHPAGQLPHITWCTTGALSFLPIHAAGCYDQAGNNIFNFAISSYTPTLSALLSSGSRSPKVGSILAVSQEATPGCSPLPATKTELVRIQQHTHSVPSTQLENDQATVNAVLDAMERCNSVHLACHGSQMPNNPTQSAFHLHDGTLSLAALARKSFINKGMAFLSACQTAAGDKAMPDEAVHLAAGMLVAGYPTVIATMWSISDGDAPLVADVVYGELMRDGKLGGGQAARALHRAVTVLREKIGEEKFGRWVAYVHIGV